MSLKLAAGLQAVLECGELWAWEFVDAINKRLLKYPQGESKRPGAWFWRASLPHQQIAQATTSSVAAACWEKNPFELYGFNKKYGDQCTVAIATGLGAITKYSKW